MSKICEGGVKPQHSKGCWARQWPNSSLGFHPPGPPTTAQQLGALKMQSLGSTYELFADAVETFSLVGAVSPPPTFLSVARRCRRIRRPREDLCYLAIQKALFAVFWRGNAGATSSARLPALRSKPILTSILSSPKSLFCFHIRLRATRLSRRPSAISANYFARFPATCETATGTSTSISQLGNPHWKITLQIRRIRR
jgi:hypothetical protein